METLIGMSESGEASEKALKQLPTCHTVLAEMRRRTPASEKAIKQLPSHWNLHIPMKVVVGVFHRILKIDTLMRSGCARMHVCVCVCVCVCMLLSLYLLMHSLHATVMFGACAGLERI